jgi:hypothetical protein
LNTFGGGGKIHYFGEKPHGGFKRKYVNAGRNHLCGFVCDYFNALKFNIFNQEQKADTGIKPPLLGGGMKEM